MSVFTDYNHHDERAVLFHANGRRRARLFTPLGIFALLALGSIVAGAWLAMIT